MRRWHDGRSSDGVHRPENPIYMTEKHGLYIPKENNNQYNHILRSNNLTSFIC